MSIVCQQTIPMKHEALFVFCFFEKAAKFEIVVCCKLRVLGRNLREQATTHKQKKDY